MGKLSRETPPPREGEPMGASGGFPAKLKHMVGKDGLKVKALPDLLGSHVRSIVKSCHPC